MTESIGMRLREAREKRQLSLQQISDTTKVRIHYLQALENDDLSAIPSAAQARGFLRIYAGFLGLEVADLVPAAPIESGAAAAIDEPQTQPNPSAPRQLIDEPTKAPRPGLLDTVRGLLNRRGKESAAGSGSSLSPVEPPTIPPETPTLGDTPRSSKKKVKP